jgi:hypothetical protein
VLFAASVILTVGVLNAIWGIGALSDRSYFHREDLLLESLKTWGWVYLIVGCAQVGIAVLVFRDTPIGFALGMFAAFLAILVNFVSVGAYPIWSVMLIVLNFVILFQLATNLGADSG